MSQKKIKRWFDLFFVCKKYEGLSSSCLRIILGKCNVCTRGRKTEIVNGIDNILLQTFDRWNLTKFTIDSYIDKLNPRMLLTIEPISQGVIQLINNGIKSRTVTEITEKNVFHVKELIKMVKDRDAFHHLDKVTGNFSVSNRKIYQAQIMGDLSAPSYIDNVSAPSK